MGAIIFTLREYLDTIIDIVGIKSGLVLNHQDVLEYLSSKFENRYLKERNLDEVIRVRSEEFECHVLFVRESIGNITKEMSKPILWGDILIKWIDRGHNPVFVMTTFAEISAKYPNQNADTQKIIDEIKIITNESEELIVEILLKYAEYQNQSSNITIPERHEWDGGVPLQDLFKCEIKSSKNEFLEQTFLDYLAVNSDLLQTIHWRNFERFCAEFFNRLGYRVVLGPGSNDGGVDIRAYNETDSTMPLILIQCKRYREDNKVDIETVKSFYTDVIFEEAELGMIITTSYIATGGKKVCQARKYPLTFAEKSDVEKWAKAMWQHSK